MNDNYKEAIDLVQFNLSMFDPQETKTLQTGIDLWVYAPRMLKALKNCTEFMGEQGLNKSAQFTHAQALIAEIESD